MYLGAAMGQLLVETGAPGGTAVPTPAGATAAPSLWESIKTATVNLVTKFPTVAADVITAKATQKASEAVAKAQAAAGVKPAATPMTTTQKAITIGTPVVLAGLAVGGLVLWMVMKRRK